MEKAEDPTTRDHLGRCGQRMCAEVKGQPSLCGRPSATEGGPPELICIYHVLIEDGLCSVPSGKPVWWGPR